MQPNQKRGKKKPNPNSHRHSEPGSVIHFYAIVSSGINIDDCGYLVVSTVLNVQQVTSSARLQGKQPKREKSQTFYRGCRRSRFSLNFQVTRPNTRVLKCSDVNQTASSSQIVISQKIPKELLWCSTL